MPKFFENGGKVNLFTRPRRFGKTLAEGILDDCYIGSISYGICFCKKSCIIDVKK